jgi:DNA repair exonuclease SbcCD nuclease subunit
MNLKVFCIGDPHIRIQDEEDIKEYLNKLEIALSNISDLDYIVILGDILHNHETLHTESLNLAILFFKLCKSFAKTFCLVGNHDYTNNSSFLKQNHWLNVCKEWDINFIVIDTPETIIKNNIQLTFCPYVPDGMFLKALNEKAENWKQSQVIFSHQLLNGAKMGSIIAEGIEEWEDEFPLLINGHIHSKQKVKHNFYCLGSSRYIGYGDLGKKTCMLITVSSSENNPSTIQLKEISLGLTCKECITIILTEDNIENLLHHPKLVAIEKRNKCKSNIKIIFKGEYELLKSFKNTSIYKQCLQSFDKIVFKPFPVKHLNINNENNSNTNNTTDENNNSNKLFLDLLKENIQEHSELQEFYLEFINKGT